jgi:SNF2 family DNA or RNA helicase
LEEFKRRKLSYAYIDGTVPIKRREAIVDQYQAGFFQTLLLHPQTGAHGLTLTKGTATIWASPIYQPDFLKQGKHRIWRGGQKKKTETILIEAEDTIEGFVYNRLNEKNTRMLNLLEILRGD